MGASSAGKPRRIGGTSAVDAVSIPQSRVAGPFTGWDYVFFEVQAPVTATVVPIYVKESDVPEDGSAILLTKCVQALGQSKAIGAAGRYGFIVDNWPGYRVGLLVTVIGGASQLEFFVSPGRQDP